MYFESGFLIVMLYFLCWSCMVLTIAVYLCRFCLTTDYVDQQCLAFFVGRLKTYGLWYISALSTTAVFPLNGTTLIL